MQSKSLFNVFNELIVVVNNTGLDQLFVHTVCACLHAVMEAVINIIIITEFI